MWAGVRAQYPTLSGSSGKGFHFGNSEAMLNPEINRKRVSIPTKLLEDLVFKICNLVFATDYSWTELYGHGRPPAYNAKSLGLAQPRVSTSGVDPTVTAPASGLAGTRRVAAAEMRLVGHL